MRTTRLIVLLTSLALLAAACGGGEDTADSASEAPSVTGDAGSEGDPAAEGTDAAADDGSDAPVSAATPTEDPAAPAATAATDGSEAPVAANPDSEFCTAVEAFTTALSQEPADPSQGEAYLAEGLTQLDAVAANAPEAAADSVAQVIGYFQEFDALLAEVGYDVEAVDQEAVAASAATYAEGLASFETQVQAECGLSLSGA